MNKALHSLAQVVFIAVVACASSFVYAQESSRAEVWPCGGDPSLLVDSTTEPVWISSNELRKHGIEMPEPQIPKSLRVAGKVTVDLLIDAEGRVKCVQVRRAHPMLKKAIRDAVLRWTFRPLTAGGRPVAVFGRLTFVLGR